MNKSAGNASGAPSVKRSAVASSGFEKNLGTVGSSGKRAVRSGLVRGIFPGTAESGFGAVQRRF